MSKFKIGIEVHVTVSADGKVRFSDEYRANVVKCAETCVQSSSTVQLRGVESESENHLTLKIRCKNHTDGLNDFLERFREEVRLLTTHGKDADILTAILDKYPALRSHPRVNELVGTFDMLSAKTQELLADSKSKPAQATPELPKPGPTTGKKTKAELRQHREEKLKGQAEDQIQPSDGSSEKSLRNIITPPGAMQPRNPAANVFDAAQDTQNGTGDKG